MSRFRRLLDILILLGIAALVCAAPQAAADEGGSRSSPGLLLDRPIDLGSTGVAAEAEITPPTTGVYWFEIAFPFPAAVLDARTTGCDRRFGQAHHEAAGARAGVVVVEKTSGRAVTLPSVDWTPMQTTTSGGHATSADRIELTLQKGVVYRVRLQITQPSTKLAGYWPHFVVEASNAVRNNGFVTSARHLLLWGVAGLGLVLAVWTLGHKAFRISSR